LGQALQTRVILRRLAHWCRPAPLLLLLLLLLLPPPPPLMAAPVAALVQLLLLLGKKSRLLWRLSTLHKSAWRMRGERPQPTGSRRSVRWHRQ